MIAKRERHARVSTTADALVLMPGSTSRPSFFHCTRTRPGFSQSRGCALFISCSVPKPSLVAASAMSLLRGHQRLFARDMRRSPVP